jgi:methylmalonyl-CoA/ethylmalonyl-CoA epimerase
VVEEGSAVIKGIHHVSVVVRDMEEAFVFYRDILGLPLSKITVVEDQGVKAALLPVGEAEIELLEPIKPESGVARFLERRGEGLHHVCLETDDIEGELARLKDEGVELIDQEPRSGLAGQVCFLHPRALHGMLVELAQPAE